MTSKRDDAVAVAKSPKSEFEVFRFVSLVDGRVFYCNRLGLHHQTLALAEPFELASVFRGQNVQPGSEASDQFLLFGEPKERTDTDFVPTALQFHSRRLQAGRFESPAEVFWPHRSSSASRLNSVRFRVSRWDFKTEFLLQTESRAEENVLPLTFIFARVAVGGGKRRGLFGVRKKRGTHVSADFSGDHRWGGSHVCHLIGRLA